MIFNPKFRTPVRVFWSRAIGMFCQPASDDAPDGWGKPFRDVDGNPINPPLGTVGGTNPYVRLLRKFTDLFSLSVSRGQDLPYPEESFDWRGLESSPGRGDMPFLHFAGPRARYFPTVETDLPLNITVEDETTSSLYETHFWYRGLQIEGPGPGLRGGCIFDQNEQIPYFIVVTGSVRSFFYTGISFWKRRVKDTDDLGWELIDTISDVGQVYLNPACYSDPTGCGSWPAKGTWDIPWHFSASGNFATTMIPLTSTRPGDSGFGGSYNGALAMKVQVTLSSVTILEALEDGTPISSTVSRTYTSTPEINRTELITISSWEQLVCRDFEWPTDNLVEFRVGVSGTDTDKDWTSTGPNAPLGHWKITPNGSDYWELDGQRYTWTEGSSLFRVDTLNNLDTCTSGCAGSYSEIDRGSIWRAGCWGADLRFKTLGMVVHISGQRGFTTDLFGPYTCNCYDDLDRFYTQSSPAGPGDYGAWAYLYMAQEMVLFKPSGIETSRAADDPRALGGSGGTFAEAFPGQGDGTLDFFPPISGSDTVYNGFHVFSVVSNLSIKQGQGRMVYGGLAVDRFGRIFHSMEFSEDAMGGARYDFTNVGAAFRYVHHHLDKDTDYEYEDADVDSLVGTTGTRKQYHPLQST